MNTYNENDFKSHEGILTSVWGPSLWHFLHSMSFNYPENPTKEQKKHYKSFIESLKNILPCKYCRINIINNFKELPITYKDMKNRYTFSLYVYNLHELINKMLNKKSNLCYEEVRERYEHFRARCNDKYKKIIKNETGCTESLYGEKSKCIIKIVPHKTKCKTFQMNRSCKKKRLTRKRTKVI